VLSATDRVLHVDLDAHMGNGLAHCFLHDRRVVLFDAFNADIYPRDATARARLDYPHPLSESTSTQEYLDLLRQQLPKVVHDVQPRLAIFNAGTDILQGDDLGGLNISREAVVQRDRLVIETLERANIPWFLVTSGGYSQESHQLIAETLRWLVARRKGRI
jgi:histone deacetylase 11